MHMDYSRLHSYALSIFPNLQNYGEDAPMLTRAQRVKLSVDATFALCLDTLKSRNYQTTIFGARRLLCVKRSKQASCVINVEVLIEAFSHHETKITITGNLTDPALQGEVIGEVFAIADQLVDVSRIQTQQPSAFPLNSLQVCIV